MLTVPPGSPSAARGGSFSMAFTWFSRILLSGQCGAHDFHELVAFIEKKDNSNKGFSTYPHRNHVSFKNHCKYHANQAPGIFLPLHTRRFGSLWGARRAHLQRSSPSWTVRQVLTCGLSRSAPLLFPPDAVAGPSHAP